MKSGDPPTGHDADLRFRQAVKYHESGKLAEAKRMCREALAKAPDHAGALNLMGALSYEAGEHQAAVKLFTKAASIDSGNARYHFNLGGALRATKSFRAALESFESARQLEARLVSKATMTETYLLLGESELKAGRPGSAADAFLAAIRLSPDAVDASPLVFDEDISLGFEVFSRMHEAENGNAAILEKLAYCAEMTGRPELAEECFATVTRELVTASLGDASFHNAYNDGLKRTQTFPLLRRRRRFENLISTFDTVKDLPGNVAECGCFRGLSAWTLASRWRGHDPEFGGSGFHIFDSFEGLSEPLPSDREGTDRSLALMMNKGSYAARQEFVAANLAPFPGISFYRGWIPERFDEVADMRFRFLNLDVDLYQPTRDSILFFFPRLVEGGIIVSDDFNWPGCRKAIEECAQIFGYKVSVSPQNQAVIRKNG